MLIDAFGQMQCENDLCSQADWKEGFKKKQVGVSDMTLLTTISNESINDNLQKRWTNAEIYTYIGAVLISVNPFRGANRKALSCQMLIRVRMQILVYIRRTSSVNTRARTGSKYHHMCSVSQNLHIIT